MELKLAQSVRENFQAYPFNRTIVELKHDGITADQSTFKPFNRTIVELKPKKQGDSGLGLEAFNRTIVELKPLCQS